MGLRLLPEVHDAMWTAAYTMQEAALTEGVRLGREEALTELLERLPDDSEVPMDTLTYHLLIKANIKQMLEEK